MRYCLKTQNFLLLYYYKEKSLKNLQKTIDNKEKSWYNANVKKNLDYIKKGAKENESSNNW